MRQSIKTSLVIAWVAISVFLSYGCSTTRIPVSGGKEIVHTKWWLESSASIVDLYYEDPNVTVWLVVNDPNSSVNPGSLTVIEPKTGITVGLTAGKGE